VNWPPEYEARPARPTAPTSWVCHGAGNGDAATPIVAVVVADAVAPALSVTVNVTVNVPPVEYTCEADGEDDEVSALLSPQRHV
jgi:hypothetical protein